MIDRLIDLYRYPYRFPSTLRSISIQPHLLPPLPLPLHSINTSTSITMSQPSPPVTVTRRRSCGHDNQQHQHHVALAHKIATTDQETDNDGCTGSTDSSKMVHVPGDKVNMAGDKTAHVEASK